MEQPLCTTIPSILSQRDVGRDLAGKRGEGRRGGRRKWCEGWGCWSSFCSIYLLQTPCSAPSRRMAKVRRSDGSRSGAKVTLASCAPFYASADRFLLFFGWWMIICSFFFFLSFVGPIFAGWSSLLVYMPEAKVRIGKMKVQLKCKFIRVVCTDRSNLFS